LQECAGKRPREVEKTWTWWLVFGFEMNPRKIAAFAFRSKEKIFIPFNTWGQMALLRENLNDRIP
jgi:hypothetical protein